MATQQKLFQNFQEYLEVERGLSQSSIFSYTSDLNKFDHFLEEYNIDITQSTEKDIAKFLKYETTQNKSNTTKARVIASLRQFYKYIENIGLIDTNPMEHVEAPKVERKVPIFLTKKEIEGIFQTFDINKIFEFRDKLLFELLYSCGLRISEACSIKLQDIDYDNNVIHVKGKGNKERLAIIGEVALNLLIHYINKIRSDILKLNQSEYLLVSQKGGPLNRKSAWRLLKKYILRSNINKHITPHTFRHSFATHILQNGGDIKTVQTLLGHMDISTTQIYTHIVNSELKKVHTKYHPRS